jgi:hypothetical protein
MLFQPSAAVFSSSWVIRCLCPCLESEGVDMSDSPLSLLALIPTFSFQVWMMDLSSLLQQCPCFSLPAHTALLQLPPHLWVATWWGGTLSFEYINGSPALSPASAMFTIHICWIDNYIKIPHAFVVDSLSLATLENNFSLACKITHAYV